MPSKRGGAESLFRKCPIRASQKKTKKSKYVFSKPGQKDKQSVSHNIFKTFCLDFVLGRSFLEFPNILFSPRFQGIESVF